MSYLNTSKPLFSDFQDYSERPDLGFFGAADIVDDSSPDAMRSLMDDRKLADFQKEGIMGFGCYSGLMGMITGDQVPHIMAEYDETDEIGNTGLVRTKHFEMAPDDFQYMQTNGAPAVGMLALSDDGEIYQWQLDPAGTGGLFKKLFRGIKKIAKKVKKRVKKFVRKTKFGRKLWKLGGKIYKTAMKVVKPLMKKLGPIAMKIAPIAAFVPGVGPAIAGGLMLTGKIAKIASALKIPFDKAGKPRPQTKKQAAAFSKMVASAGRKMGKRRAAGILAKYRDKKMQRGRCRCGRMAGTGLGAVFDDPNVNSYYLTPDQSNVGWF